MAYGHSVNPYLFIGDWDFLKVIEGGLRFSSKNGGVVHIVGSSIEGEEALRFWIL